MKNQVLRIEQMHSLIELGVDTSKASMFYVPKLNPKDECVLLNVKPVDIIPHIPTFTLQDILELLPREITVELDAHKTVYLLNVCLNQGEWEVSYCRNGRCREYFIGPNILREAYNMLVWLAENKYLTKTQI